MRVTRVGGLLVVMAMAAAAVAAGDCRYEATREGTASASGAAEVLIDVGAGFLRVTGVDGLDQVRVSGQACADREKDLERIELSVRRSGDRVVVESRFPEGSWLSGGSMRLDLTVEVPARMTVDVDDGSGDMVITSVASVRVDDGSGEIEISEIAGDVSIEDGSGEIEVRRVGGTVRVTDGSGEIEIAHVDRDVVIDDDGSGDIDIQDVAGDVLVDNDGSGDIDVRDVGGRFEVVHDGSGDIRHGGIAGTVETPERHRGH